MIRGIAAGALILALGGLAGCSTGPAQQQQTPSVSFSPRQGPQVGGTPQAPAPGTPSGPATAGASASPGSPTATPDGEPNTGGARFGQTTTWENGLQVSIGQPQTFEPTGGSGGGKFTDRIVLEVRVTNGTGQPYAPSKLAITAQSGSGNGEPITDPGQGVAQPAEDIPAGGEVTYKVAFGVENRADLLIVVDPGDGLPPAAFTA
ncbi:hypothetical protein [Granulicoccus phenolivorans]|uniref:hypothetical protein n=1 Tax=Granulicoccus phenolivorans TaxID=266854 RepID=UPI000402A960|nr:hypothetical protein [Granulicoccus phenolivorans]